jgi:thiaminase/transcriptional activator TenA
MKTLSNGIWTKFANMTISTDLWESNQDLAQACLEHPFVQGIATGTLDRVKFAYYVGQDAFFLEAFARAYSLAAAKAPDWEGFNTFHSLAGGVLQELRLHEGYAANGELTWEMSNQHQQRAATPTS